MRNYGEELAFWYFRLNGFIPMTDLVLHHKRPQFSSDCDLLAVRFPQPYEEIGGQTSDWDSNLLHKLGQKDNTTLITFVQVKTADEDNPGSISEYFSNHLEYLLGRVGAIPQKDIKKQTKSFNRMALLPWENFVFSKVLVHSGIHIRKSPPPWIELQFKDLAKFVFKRMDKYRPDKFSDRMFFPNNIVQMMTDIECVTAMQEALTEISNAKA